MPIIYWLLATLLWLIALPILLLFSLKTKYKNSIPARFWLWHNPPLPSGGVWFHQCSYGESVAVKPLIDKFDISDVRCSVTTQTGYDFVSKITSNSRYLPYEIFLPFWIQEHKVLVVMEAELWYMLFFVARLKGAKCYLINARVSDRSYPRYKKIKWFYRYIFANIDRVYAQSQKDATRLKELGAEDIVVVGNIKSSQPLDLNIKLNKPKGRLIVTAGSTHKGEEEIILKAFKALKAIRDDAILILVPRHPERFESVWSLIKEYRGFEISKYSTKESIEGDIVLIDSMGMLVDCYAISDIAIVGGAFEPIGGHNAIEAAQFGIPVISGSNYFNQKELFNSIGDITICEANELRDRLTNYQNLPTSYIKDTTKAIDIIYKDISNVLYHL